MTDKIKRHKFLIGAFVLPFLLMELIAIIMKVEPFGSQSFLIVDALHQYLPFFADYHEKLRSADSFFYSFHAGLGYNFLGLWAYYLASPLNLMIVFFPKTMLNMVLSHLYIVKISLCCFTAAFYFYKRMKKDDLSIIAFGMAYGFSSYIVGYSWNIMWLEVMILLPIILYGFDKMVTCGNGKLYCAALFFSLWCNFYMSFMTCLFLVLWYIFYEHKNIIDFIKNGFRFAVYSLLSAAMAAAVLLPAYLGIMQTSSAKWDFPKELWYGTFGDIFTRQFLGTKPLTMSVDDSKINLYCGIFTLLMALFYLVSKEIKRSIRIRRLCLLAILFFSFNMPVPGFIWHGFHNQYGIPNRFAFVYIFLLLSMAYDGYILAVNRSRRQAKKMYISLGLLFFIMAIALYTTKTNPKMNTVYITAVVAIAYVLFFFLYERKILHRKVCMALSCMGLIVEMTAMAFLGFSSNGTIDVNDYFNDTKSIAKIKETYGGNDDISKRMELASGKMLDESIWHTLNCVTLFGSTARGKMVDLMDKLGFYTGVNEYLYEGATPFTNNLFSIKYQLYRPQDMRPTSFEIADSVGDVSVYKNPYTTAIGYGMSSKITSWDYKDVNPFYVQNDLIQRAYGISDLFQMVDTKKPEVNGCKITSDNGGGEYVFDKVTARPDNLVFTINVKKQKQLYLHFDCSRAENTIIEKNGDQIMTGRLNSQVLYLGNLKEGDEIQVKVQLKEEKEEGVMRLTLAEFHEDVLSDLHGEMEAQAFHITKQKSSNIQGTINMEKDGMAFFSISYDKGWTAYVDGKKVKTKAIGDAFLSVPVSKGTHKIELRYVSPGFKEGILISIVGFIIFGILCGWEIRKKKISNLKQICTIKYGTLGAQRRKES